MRARRTFANMLRGLHDSRIPLLVALLGYWAIGAPVGVVLGFATPLGAVGVWIGLALGLAVVAILLTARWVKKERQGFAV
jgi:MATE family multidrug resistance protein